MVSYFFSKSQIVNTIREFADDVTQVLVWLDLCFSLFKLVIWLLQVMRLLQILVACLKWLVCLPDTYIYIYIYIYMHLLGKKLTLLCFLRYVRFCQIIVGVNFCDVLHICMIDENKYPSLILHIILYIYIIYICVCHCDILHYLYH